MHEGDVESLDAVTVERVMVDTRKGPTEMKKYAPVPEETSPIPKGSTGHQTMTDNVYVVNNNIGDMDVDNDISDSAVDTLVLCMRTDAQNLTNFLIRKVTKVTPTDQKENRRELSVFSPADEAALIIAPEISHFSYIFPFLLF